MSLRARKQSRISKWTGAVADRVENNSLAAAFRGRLESSRSPFSNASIDQAVAEVLEGRTLMSTVTLADGLLTIDGTGDARLNADVAYIRGSDKIRVTASGADVRKQSFPAVQVRAIKVVGTNGDDRIRLARNVDLAADIQVGDGNDRVIGGHADDVIDGGTGRDRLSGHNGNDIISGGTGMDVVRGGAGNDLLRGDDGNDRLVGNKGNDTLQGGRGNDRMSGGNGNDTLTGGEDRDTFSGGSGTNTLTDATEADRSGRVTPPTVGEGSPTPDDSDEDTVTPPADSDDTDESNTDGGTTTPGNGGNTSTPGGTTNPSNGSAGAKDGASWGGVFDPTLAKNAAPKAVLRFVGSSQTGPAGHTVNVNATSSQFFNGDAVGAKFEWDFGDAGTKYNKLVGWTAAHTYDKPGTYTIRLTVTDVGGKSTTVTNTVTIAQDNRRSIFVDAIAGNDANDGSTEAEAVKTLEQAVALSSDNTKILMKKGQIFDVKDPLRITGRNVIVDAYGTGKTAPTVRKIAGGLGNSIFYIAPSATGFLAQNMYLDSIWGFGSVYGKKRVPAEAFSVTANNFTVRNSAFFNVDTGVTTEMGPSGVLVQNNYFSNGIRSYCIWSQGYDHAYLGNVMVNSQQEHLIRSDGADGKGVVRVLIHDNDLSRTVANGKGSIELRTSSWYYVSGNRIKGGTLRAGLQAIDQKKFPHWASYKNEYGVIENNVTEKVYINIRPGTKHLAIRNNVVKLDDFYAIHLENIEAGYDHVRKTEDVRIERNTVISMGSTGHFLRVHGKATGVTVRSNLYIAPHLSLDGSGRSAGIEVSGVSDLSGFTDVSGNIWPDLAGTNRQDGLNYVGSDKLDLAGYKSKLEWDALWVVKNEIYKTVLPGNSYQARVGSVTAGSTLQKAA